MNKHLIAALIIAASTAAAAPTFASSRYDSASAYAPASQGAQSIEAARTENTNTSTQSVGSAPETTSYVMAANDSDMLYSHH
jgi:nucleoid-associated protein YgaU